MEEEGFSETVVPIYETTWYSNSRENLKETHRFRNKKSYSWHRNTKLSSQKVQQMVTNMELGSLQQFSDKADE